MPTRQREDDDGKPIPNLWDIVVNVPRDRGERRRRKSYVFRGTKRAAEAELRRLQGLADAGKLTVERYTLGHVFDRFLAEHAAKWLAPATHQSYINALQGPHGQRIRPLQLAKLKLHHLTEHETYLREDAVHYRGGKASKNYKGLRPHSVVIHVTAIRQALEWAESVDLLAKNPARHWKARTEKSAQRPDLDKERARVYLAAIEGTQWEPHLLTFLSTNMRLSEVRGWRIQDLDLKTGTYDVVQQWQRVGSRDVRRPVTKSDAGQRGGGLPGPVVVVLERWLEQLRFARRAAKGKWKDPEGGALVFPQLRPVEQQRNAEGRVLRRARPAGGPFSGDALRDFHYRRLAEHHLPRVRLHDMRHTWFNLQIEAGTPFQEASKLMGHASEEVSRKVYYHLTRTMGKRAADRMWKYLEEAGAIGPDAVPPSDEQSV